MFGAAILCFRANWDGSRDNFLGWGGHRTMVKPLRRFNWNLRLVLGKEELKFPKNSKGGWL